MIKKPTAAFSQSKKRRLYKSTVPLLAHLIMFGFLHPFPNQNTQTSTFITTNPCTNPTRHSRQQVLLDGKQTQLPLLLLLLHITTTHAYFLLQVQVYAITPPLALLQQEVHCTRANSKMVISNVFSCLNSSPPPPTPLPSSPPQPITGSTTHLPWSWRKSSVTGMACVIVVSAVGLSGESYAVELALGGRPAVQEEVGNVKYWSQRRACPAWRDNSLENIVPENLPRPFSARRRMEVAGVDVAAPAVGVSSTSRTISKCFSL